MPSLSHLLLNFLKLRPHAVASGFPFDLELSAAACSADEGEAQKVEGPRSSDPPTRAPPHCKAPKPDQRGLLRRERHQQPPQSTPHRFLEAAGIFVDLKRKSTRLNSRHGY